MVTVNTVVDSTDLVSKYNFKSRVDILSSLPSLRLPLLSNKLCDLLSCNDTDDNPSPNISSSSSSPLLSLLLLPNKICDLPYSKTDDDVCPYMSSLSSPSSFSSSSSNKYRSMATTNFNINIDVDTTDHNTLMML